MNKNSIENYATAKKIKDQFFKEQAARIVAQEAAKKNNLRNTPEGGQGGEQPPRRSIRSLIVLWLSIVALFLALITLVVLVLNDRIQSLSIFQAIPGVSRGTYMIAPAIIAAGIAAAASGGQAYAQGKMNKKTREWNEKMYGVQRQDALADWERTNAYNSPLQQMQRLEEAGLNKNLIYGGAPGQEAGSVRSASPGNLKQDAPDFGSVGKSAVSTFFESQAATQQLENAQQQKANMEQARQNAMVDNSNKLVDGMIKLEVLDQKKMQNSGYYDLYDQNLSNMRAQARLIGEQTNESQARQLEIGSRTDLNNQKFFQLEKMFPKQMQLIDANIANVGIRSGLTAEQINQVRSSIGLAGMDLNLKARELDLLNDGLNKTGSPLWKIITDAVKDRPGTTGGQIRDKGVQVIDAIKEYLWPSSMYDGRKSRSRSK